MACHTASVHHDAQAMCREGRAASSLAWEASPLWPCQEPIAPLAATTSVKPPSIRGGATGKRQKTTNASTLLSSRMLRSGR